MLEVQNFIDNIKSICKKNGLPLGQVLTDCNLNKNFLSSAKSRQTLPSAENLLTIANYFNVSVDYLLGRTDNPEINR